MTIKSVLFDLDGTLLDRDRSIEQFIDLQYDRLNCYLSHIPKVDYATKFIQLESNGHVWKDEVYRNLAEAVDDRMRIAAVLFLKTTIRSNLNFHNEHC